MLADWDAFKNSSTRHTEMAKYLLLGTICFSIFECTRWSVLLINPVDVDDQKSISPSPQPQHQVTDESVIYILAPSILSHPFSLILPDSSKSHIARQL
jgi:hypothetical protein